MRAKRKLPRPQASGSDRGDITRGLVEDTPRQTMETRVSIPTKEEPIVDKSIGSFSLTSGLEVFPWRNGSFSVGPITVTCNVTPGEDLRGVFKRARHTLEVLFQAEYDLKRFSYQARLDGLKS